MRRDLRVTIVRSWAVGMALLLVLLAACAPAPEPLPPVPAATPTPAAPVRFPDDAAPHDALTEWWYYTGHLRAQDGGAPREYGFEFTIFQVRRADHPTGYLAHFAVTDLERGVFSHQARFITSPFQPGPTLDVSGWRLDMDGVVETIEAAMQPGPGAELPFALRLSLMDRKPPVLHNGGYIEYGPVGGSYYYSRTRLEVSGELVDPEHGPLPVVGQAWMDHQWGNFLVTGSGGWDWYSLQLEDGTDLMLYVLRSAQGDTSAVYGSLVLASGAVRDLRADTVQIEVLDRWESPHTGAIYPSGWRLELPDGRALVVLPRLKDQELYFPGAEVPAPVYWEGAVSVHAETPTGPRIGRGYVELTGYAP